MDESKWRGVDEFKISRDKVDKTWSVSKMTPIVRPLLLDLEGYWCCLQDCESWKITKFGGRNHVFHFGHFCRDSHSLFLVFPPLLGIGTPTLSEESGREVSAFFASSLVRMESDLFVTEIAMTRCDPAAFSFSLDSARLQEWCVPLCFPFHVESAWGGVHLLLEGYLEARPSLLPLLWLSGCKDVILQHCICSADPNSPLGGSPRGLELG